MNKQSVINDRSWCRCASLALLMVITASQIVRAEEPDLPRSVPEAVRMERDNALPRTDFYNEGKRVLTSKPGDLLKKAVFNGYELPEGATAVRILYHSLDADNRDVATSGVVLVPAGKAPADGWPVIAWAHGTSGVAQQCAPSLQKDVYYGEEGLMPMVRAGFAVVATDYHGLGTHGLHQYINKLAQANDVIFSVIAARKAVASLGKKWVVDGHSQGGLAAWGVAEAETALNDPDYLGAVSVAGALQLQQALTEMGSGHAGAASFYLPFMAYAASASGSAGTRFNPAGILMGPALKKYADVIRNGCWFYAYASFLDSQPEQLLQANWSSSQELQHLFAVDQLAELPVSKPLLVIGGEADHSVPFPMLKAVALRACQKGVQLTFRSYPGLDHDPVMSDSVFDQLAWIRNRFAGTPAINSCPELEAGQ